MEISTKQEKKRKEDTNRKKESEQGNKDTSFPRPVMVSFT